MVILTRFSIGLITTAMTNDKEHGKAYLLSHSALVPGVHLKRTWMSTFLS